MTDQPPSGGSYPPPPPPGSSGAAPSGGHLPPSAPPPPGSSGDFSQSFGGSAPPPPPPPPPAGGYPPPPPAAGGYAPPPPGPAVKGLATDAYTPWLTRFLAFLIDYAPILVVLGIAQVVDMLTREESCVTSVNQYDVAQYCYSQGSMIGVLAQGLASLLILAYVVWNYGYRQGTTGSSIGKSILKFKVVSEVTGEPLGFGMSLVRQLAHFVDAIICYVGFLFPLWDSKRQTLADKIMTTVCLPI
ncbi:hypothetical protein C0J29_24185 [Mycobacterium paragordonae]|uniref:RDD family protein n=1 Tax=Mycobacterium paragordonae TaxID=1389713 RepID=A0AAJ1S7U3_9MYCO|nr:RDD family protein [Mycobacterium paragordonae]AYE97418.1 hypothetical protein C0J29_24185 [Mycobacterium paragordonae]MDP7739136.1 RDD family protein [Mycobacterium paragordonae]GFG81092.1 hypothetical protein MPRG_43680 [Mycobacterium paragordonae]